MPKKGPQLAGRTMHRRPPATLVFGDRLASLVPEKHLDDHQRVEMGCRRAGLKTKTVIEDLLDLQVPLSHLSIAIEYAGNGHVTTTVGAVSETGRTLLKRVAKLLAANGVKKKDVL